VQAFVILSIIPIVVLFVWSLSSLFTRNFLRYGIYLSYGAIFAMATSFLAVTIFAAWYDDVWQKYSQYNQDASTCSVGWGFWLMFAMIAGSFVSYAASLSLAAKTGDNTTQAAVTRNWGDAPFSGKKGMAEGNGGTGGGGGGGGQPPALAPRPSVPDRPNPNRGAPAVAPRPAGGWFSKAPAKPQLAAGWTEVKSSNGDVYYWNSSTNESTWDVPLAAPNNPPARPPAPAANRAPAPLTRQGSGRGGASRPAPASTGGGMEI